MVSATELDIFTRSLNGDRRARTELFKKYLRDNSRLCRLGAGYPNPNDFLHDCFNNLLRTGHAWDRETDLTQWVNSVALWTLLENERQRDMGTRAAQGEIRMCAEIEGTEAGNAGMLEAYAPPLLGAEDSPATRILRLLNESERTIFRKRAMENGTWEQVAEAAGKPMNTVGPVFARVVTRIARFFGSPPVVDDDLLPVFSRAASDPNKPVGRSVTMQIDPIFYGMTPEMKNIGLTTSHEFRSIILWDTASKSTPPEAELRQHLDKCRYCSSLLRALLRMQQALAVKPGAEFHLCPGAFTLANAADLERDAFDQHLAQCSICRDERTQVLEGQTSRHAATTGEPEAAPGAGKKIAWAAAALVVLGIGSFAGYRYIAAQKVAAARATAASTAANQNSTTLGIDPRYRDLVREVPLDERRIMNSVLPRNRTAVKYALDQFSLGEIGQSLMVSSKPAVRATDPGVQMLYAMSLYRTGLMTDGYREMLVSEGMTPRETFRCWVLFQFALMVGDRAVINREAEHLSADPQYADQVKAVMAKIRERG